MVVWPAAANVLTLEDWAAMDEDQPGEFVDAPTRLRTAPPAGARPRKDLVGDVRERCSGASGRRELGDEHRRLPDDGVNEELDVHAADSMVPPS